VTAKLKAFGDSTSHRLQGAGDIVSAQLSHTACHYLPRASEAGVFRGSVTPNLCGGDTDMYIPLEKPNT